MDGWAKVKDGYQYAGVKEKTFRGWLKEGLKHSRLPSGHILIKYSNIDAYLLSLEISESSIDKAVNEILRDF